MTPFRIIRLAAPGPNPATRERPIKEAVIARHFETRGQRRSETRTSEPLTRKALLGREVKSNAGSLAFSADRCEFDANIQSLGESNRTGSSNLSLSASQSEARPLSPEKRRNGRFSPQC